MNNDDYSVTQWRDEADRLAQIDRLFNQMARREGVTTGGLLSTPLVALTSAVIVAGVVSTLQVLKTAQTLFDILHTFGRR